MKKAVRELSKAASERGFQLEGLDGGDHYVFRNPNTGLIVRAANTARADVATQVKRLKSQMANAERLAGTRAQVFRSWVLKRYKIGLRGQKVISVKTADLAAEFNAEHPGEHIDPGHVTVMMGQDRMFKRLMVDRHTGVNEVQITGPLFELAAVEDEETEAVTETCGAATKIRGGQGGVAVCTLAKGHPGPHRDGYRNHSWAEGEGVDPLAAEPEVEPVIAQTVASLPRLEQQIDSMVEQRVAERIAEVEPEPAEGPISVGGLTLSPELADQLRVALGVNDHAAVIEQSKRAVALAAAALHDALAALNGAHVEVVRPGRSPRGSGHADQQRSGIGEKRRQRLDQIREAVNAGQLPARFTTDDVARLLGIGSGAAISTLASGFAHGDTVVRVGPSTYEVV